MPVTPPARLNSARVAGGAPCRAGQSRVSESPSWSDTYAEFAVEFGEAVSRLASARVSIYSTVGAPPHTALPFGTDPKRLVRPGLQSKAAGAGAGAGLSGDTGPNRRLAFVGDNEGYLALPIFWRTSSRRQPASSEISGRADLPVALAVWNPHRLDGMKKRPKRDRGQK